MGTTAEIELQVGEGKQIPSPKLSNKHQDNKKQKNVLKCQNWDRLSPPAPHLCHFPPILASSCAFETLQHFPGALLQVALLDWGLTPFLKSIISGFGGDLLTSRGLSGERVATAISASRRGFLCQKDFRIDLKPSSVAEPWLK